MSSTTDILTKAEARKLTRDVREQIMGEIRELIYADAPQIAREWYADNKEDVKKQLLENAEKEISRVVKQAYVSVDLRY